MDRSRIFNYVDHSFCNKPTSLTTMWHIKMMHIMYFKDSGSL